MPIANWFSLQYCKQKLGSRSSLVSHMMVDHKRQYQSGHVRRLDMSEDENCVNACVLCPVCDDALPASNGRDDLDTLIHHADVKHPKPNK